MTPRSRSSLSVQRQLEEVRAPAGSALEQLIRDHQDFSVLPDHEDDPLGLPPWLKVWWRKTQPGIDESRGPVAYPLILEQILEWMRRHPDNPTPGLAPQAGDQGGRAEGGG